MSKKVLININTIDSPIWGGEGYVSGVGRSTYCLLHALDKIKLNSIKIVTCKEGYKYVFSKSKFKHFSFFRIITPEKYAMFFRKLLFHNYLYHYPNNYFARTLYGEKFVITIHDTIQYERALQNNNIKLLRLINENVRNCICIITCSEYSRCKIVEHFPFASSKVKVIPWGVDTSIFKIKSSYDVNCIIKKYGISDKYFLSVSCKDPRKNIVMLLSAFKMYLHRGGKCSLVLLWDEVPQAIIDNFSQELADRQIVFIPFVPDEDLVCLYNGAQCTLFPSLEEGFGFPILESFACGTPVLTCRNSSLEEVGGNLAVYGPESLPEEFSCYMLEVENIQKDQFKKDALEYVARFTWEDTAQKYIALYEELLDKL